MNLEHSADHSADGSDAAESGDFTRTDWECVWDVEQPGERGQRALDRLCSQYWQPLLNHLRRGGMQLADAEDCVQGFFADFLRLNGFGRAKKEDGRLRTFLLRSLKHHVAAERRKTDTVKRWGHLTQADGEEGDTAVEAGQAAAFDLDWAVALRDAALESVRREVAVDDAGRALWQELKDLVPLHDAPHGACAAAAKVLRLNKNSLRSRLDRMRESYDTALVGEAMRTLRAKSYNAITEELRALGLLREQTKGAAGEDRR